MSYPVKMSNTLHKEMSAMLFSPFLVSFALFVFVYDMENYTLKQNSIKNRVIYKNFISIVEMIL